jgi:hypothetical protein
MQCRRKSVFKGLNVAGGESVKWEKTIFRWVVHLLKSRGLAQLLELLASVDGGNVTNQCTFVSQCYTRHLLCPVPRTVRTSVAITLPEYCHGVAFWIMACSIWSHHSGCSRRTHNSDVLCDMTPCNLIYHYQQFGGTCCNISPLKMEAAAASEMLVTIRTTWCHISQGS